MTRLLTLIGFLSTIVLANWAIETYGIVPVGFGLTAPAGVYFAGLAFGFRDALHEAAGRSAVVLAIVSGAALSALIAPRFALASGVAFLVSEAADLGVYDAIRRRSWPVGVVASNIVGAIVDSALFLWIAFGSLDFLAGQVVAKTYMVVPAILLVQVVRSRQPAMA